MSKEASKKSLFPRFLLPSQPRNHSPQSPQSPQSPPPPLSSSSPSSSSTPNLNLNHTDKYLNGHASYLRCSDCAVHLCLTSQIISKGFTGRHGRAYLVSGEVSGAAAPAVSVSASSSATASLPNTLLQRPVPRQLVTGAHTVSDVCCAFCGSVLGWKYVAAEEESQRYKVGKFILETKKTMATSCWESPPSDPEPELDDHRVRVQVDADALPRGEREDRDRDRGDVYAKAEVEFDSQDEDECEDLFAGIWSSGLASRRRSRKVERKPTMFGIS
ncbi:hypothetical protein N7509_009841 [Penicillium cosmopolitanum]|uniref:Yippee domain-containing protein n=1 Tax=Penicillium cosmopolitanum TaxID=1131564 RepID=A0A9W9VQC3_9EURO|nr:uncharacterized protein N7509_009841 [Penicillium cosmopolitanum]KAJ5387300.1 hypothetical protein N7509_009841 [Penicillium cosmopolitanum]